MTNGITYLTVMSQTHVQWSLVILMGAKMAIVAGPSYKFWPPGGMCDDCKRAVYERFWGGTGGLTVCNVVMMTSLSESCVALSTDGPAY